MGIISESELLRGFYTLRIVQHGIGAQDTEPNGAEVGVHTLMLKYMGYTRRCTFEFRESCHLGCFICSPSLCTVYLLGRKVEVSLGACLEARCCASGPRAVHQALWTTLLFPNLKSAFILLSLALSHSLPHRGRERF